MEEEHILTTDIVVFVEYSFELEAGVGEYLSFSFLKNPASKLTHRNSLIIYFKSK